MEVVNWRWSLVAIVVTLSLARWAIEATRLGQEAAPIPEAPAAAPVTPQVRNHPAGDGQLPENYPSDVPVWEQAEILETIVSPRVESVAWSVVFTAAAGPGAIEGWYRPQLEARGWRVTRLESIAPELPANDPGRVLVALKDGRRLELLWPEGAGAARRTVSQTLVEPVTPTHK